MVDYLIYLGFNNMGKSQDKRAMAITLTELRSRNHAHDRRIAPKVAAVGWYFFPKSCVECILRENLLFLLFFT